MPPTAPTGTPLRRTSRRMSSGVRAASVDDVLARQSLERRLGGLSTFSGKRNVTYALGYAPTLRPRDYRERYERGDIAATIVDFYPAATFLAGTMVVETEDPDEVTAFERATVELFDRLDAIGRFKRAAKLSGLGRYSVLVIGGGDLSQELPRPLSAASITVLTPLGEDRAQIGHPLITDTRSERFGLPAYYNVNFGSSSLDGSSSIGLSSKVHWSRVIHVANNLLEDELFGDPILRRVWNKLDDLEKLVGGGSEAAWRRMDPGLHLNLDPELQLTSTQEDELVEHLDEYQHGLRRTLTTRGAEVNPLNANVTTFSANTATIISLISAATGIPQRVLSGSERGELASSQDRSNLADRIAEYRSSFAEPIMLSLVSRLVDYGALPKPREMSVAWPEEDELSEIEKADVTLKIAQANRTSGKIIMTPSEMRDRFWSLEPLDPSEETPTVTTQPPPSTVSTETQPATEILAATAHLASDRVVIIGGPRCGKSTLARHLRETRSLPTFCGDPEGLVKDPEPGVTYLQDGLAWSDASQHIADVWLTQPGPWCVEGVSVVRAMRKLVAAGNAKLLEGVDIVHLQSPQTDQSTGQQSMAKGVATIWSEIAAYFPQAVSVVSAETPDVTGASRSPRVASRKRKTSVEARKAALFGFRAI